MKDVIDADSMLSTIEAARELGMAVRSVQLMVDRGELEAWKTPGGHRRISRASVTRWLQSSGRAAAVTRDGPRGPAPAAFPSNAEPPASRDEAVRRVLLIEDSAHFQNLVSLIVRHAIPGVDLHVAADGISGLAMYGQLQPDVLLVDILLPGIDGATLISGLRTSPQFSHSSLIVVTSLDENERAPYAFALEGIPVVHKSRLAAELPALLAREFKQRRQAVPG